MKEEDIAIRIARSFVSKEKRIKVIERILENGTAEEIDGFLVDMTTANMLRLLYNALGNKLKPKFDKVPIEEMVKFGWSVMK
jgi:hypothetical protein